MHLAIIISPPTLTNLYTPLYTTDATAYSNAHFGQDTSIIIALDDVACTTAQSRLIDCTHDSDTADCSHSDDAGVQCVPSELPDSELGIPI